MRLIKKKFNQKFLNSQFIITFAPEFTYKFKHYTIIHIHEMSYRSTLSLDDFSFNSEFNILNWELLDNLYRERVVRTRVFVLYKKYFKLQTVCNIRLYNLRAKSIFSTSIKSLTGYFSKHFSVDTTLYVYVFKIKIFEFKIL